MSTQPENELSTQKPAEGLSHEDAREALRVLRIAAPIHPRFSHGTAFAFLQAYIEQQAAPAAPSPAVAPPIEAREFLRQWYRKTFPHWTDASLAARLDQVESKREVELMTAYYAACRSKESDRQERVRVWATRCFGEEHVTNPTVRGLRLAEEAIEFAQAVGVHEKQLLRLVEYVCGRKAGEPEQELGGVGVTALAAAVAIGVKFDEAVEREIRRVESKPDEHFTQRNQNKIDLGFAGQQEEK